MRDYADTAAELRARASIVTDSYDVDPYNAEKTAMLMEDAADAIEELLGEVERAENRHVVESEMIGEMYAEIERLKAKVPTWIMIESRPMDKEEREYYSERYDFPLNEDEAVIYCCPLPEHGQEVLVLNRYGRIWLDTFDDDPDYGVGFETNGDMDGIVAWMPLPAPPKGVE